MIDTERTETLLGVETLARLRKLHVAVYGLGGVGGWCAEALLRSGVGRLTIIDDDIVQPSNLNRQCCATAKTLGMKKADAMRARLLEIDPDADVIAVPERFVPGMKPVACDVIVDAIDSVDCKCALILAAKAAGVGIVSSLGAAKRLDPTKVTLKRFSRVEGDGLARAMRQRFKRLGEFPDRDLLCAVSSELPASIGTLGSMMPVTAAFGLALASAVMRLDRAGSGLVPERNI